MRARSVAAEPSVVAEVRAAPAEAEEGGAVTAVEREGSMPPGTDESPAPAWPDESAESAFRAEARERGELAPPAAAAAEAEDEAEPRALPPLDELVQKIAPEVREALDDLFRARFVRVTRVPASSLTPARCCPPPAGPAGI